MIGILASFGVAFFKSGTDITLKYANKIISSDRTLLFYQRVVETALALALILYVGFESEVVHSAWISDFNFWLLAVATVSIAGSAFFFYLKALRLSDASLVAPMMLLTPGILLITSPIILGEFASLLGTAGVLFIVFGSYIMGFSLEKTGKISLATPFVALFREAGVRYALLASVLYGISGNLDKIGVTQSSPFVWIFVQGFLLVIGVGVVMCIKNRNEFVLTSKQAGTALIPGVTGAVSSILQMVAISLWQVSYVVAVKRLSALFTIAAGGLLFKEKGIAIRLAGAAFMILGVLCIVFFG